MAVRFPLMAIALGLPLAACTTAPSPSAVSQSVPQADDWPSYGHDRGGHRHSPLAQITPANVAGLAPAWTYHMKPPAAAAAVDPAAAAQAAAEATGSQRPSAGGFIASQATPLVVDGRMFLTTPYGRAVALDPATGTELWVSEVAGVGQLSLRGVEYWAGDTATAPRIFFGTRGGRLVALDAATGARASGFGTDGIVDLRTPEVLQGARPGSYGMTSPPIVFEDLVITGSAVQEFPPLGLAGDVRAWDARTGALVWTFHSVPREGEPGRQTWADGSATNRSGVNAWGFITVDEARGLAFIPFGAPAFDRYGGDRVGDNLYGTSLVAVDARTGGYRWHYQVVHHDIWDNDLQAAPLLFDQPMPGGGTRPAVALTSKNGLLFILDRETGQPLLPVEERPFPASDVPGEVASPTQPIPLATPPLVRTTFDIATDVATLTPELEATCRAWIAEHQMIAGGLYVPIALGRNTINFPGLQGGANWGGMSHDPARGLLIVNTNELGQVTSLVPAAEGSPLPYTRGPVSGRFQPAGTRLLCQQPPWGNLTAIDTASGAIAWSVPLGVTDELPEAVRQTGRPNIGGAITTAAGVTFIGATDDARFRAFDTASGRILWEAVLPAAAHATPITYAGADGRQFVAITATGGSFLGSPIVSDAVIAFALPVETQP